MRHRSLMFLLAASLGGVAGAPAAVPAERNTLPAIDHGTLPGGTLVLRFAFARELEDAPRMFQQYYPLRAIVIDRSRADSAIGEVTRDLDFRGVRRIHVAESTAGLRLSVRLDEPRVAELTVHHGNDIWLTLEPLNVDPRPHEDWREALARDR